MPSPKELRRDAGPWILGHRGAPAEAPENTLVSFARALEHGLDGVEYDLQACATGEPIVLHDDTLDRTTDLSGPIEERTLPELFGVDAGGWFHRDFLGEPLPLLDEALELEGDEFGTRPMHMIELKNGGLVRAVARSLEERRGTRAYIASFDRAVCLEARDAGIPSMLLAVIANESDRRFVRDERIDAYGVGPGGWRDASWAEAWSCQRWGWSIDRPGDLVEVCRDGFFGFNTNEPVRALAVRRLLELVPDYEGSYPIEVPQLEVVPGTLPGTRGGWCGRWSVEARIANPFPFPVEAQPSVRVRGGAFEVRGDLNASALSPGTAVAIGLELVGGSWSPGADPLLAVCYRWKDSDGRACELELDAPLSRVRTLSLGDGPRRVELLRETRLQEPASMVVRRQGRFLVCSIEHAGGLRDARAAVSLGGVVRVGARGVRILLDETLGRPDGVGGVRSWDFSCGIEGVDKSGTRCWRRFSGGLPGGLRSGAPGRLLTRSTS